MSIAQRLCNEIVEPVLQNTNLGPFVYMTQSKKGLASTSGSGYSRRHASNQRSRTLSGSKRESVPITSLPYFTSRDFIGPIRSSIRSNGICTKRTKAANTENEDEPVMCDTECMTNVRRRDSCKCTPTKINCKASNKKIQTMLGRNPTYVNRACSADLEIVSSGTQFQDVKDNRRKHQRDIIIDLDTIESSESSGLILKKSKSRRNRNESHDPHKLTYHSCKRWALSRTQVQGPDF